MDLIEELVYSREKFPIIVYIIFYHHFLKSFLLKEIICVTALNYKFTSVLNCCRKDSVNLSRCSEAVIYSNIVVDMGETNDSI